MAAVMLDTGATAMEGAMVTTRVTTRRTRAPREAVSAGAGITL